jgi:guanine nucleotide-binding protein G(i) subunit alpha
MGCCGGASEDPDSKKRNEDIEKQIKADKTRMRNEVKLLLLGNYKFIII